MDILIKNIEMPKEMECVEILLFSNGHCSFRKHERDEWVEAWAVALPSHGDLIDRKELLKFDNISYIDTGYWVTDYEAVKTSIIKKAPVIVEATE